MKKTKEATAEVLAAADEDIELINRWTKKRLERDDVFIFELLLCDNEIDRDFERFETKALDELAPLFVGKTGIFDHEWSSGKQKSRIFRTRVIRDEGRRTVSGEEYVYLKAWAYMLREGNDELIAEIEGGIKREVSIGCSMAKETCSICGEEIESFKCGHVPGRDYDGRLCYTILSDAKDAYEWSFVAVPAQKNAGVIKKFKGERKNMTLEELVEERADEELKASYERLKTMSRLGESYISGLRDEVVRLGVLSNSGFDRDFLKSAAAKMGEEELIGFKKAFESQIETFFPLTNQLGGKAGPERFSGEEFLI